MADKLLISVSADQATAVVWRSGKLGTCEVFGSDADGMTAFDKYLSGLRRMPVELLLDVVEEDYRFEMLPHATGRDRGELIERRLRQLYRNTPYCGAVLQGRETDKRRDDQYLFFALLNPDLLDVWLTPIGARDLPVSGVYLLPATAETLVQKIAPGTPNVLLVANHPSGMRLSFFRSGKLRVSRLTQVEDTDAQARVAAYTEEIDNTRLYLHALRVMSLDEPLTIVALDWDGTFGGLDQAVARDIANAQALVLGTTEVAVRSGVPDAILTDVPDALYLHALAVQPIRANLAPAAVTEPYRLFQMRRALYATAGIAACVSTAWMGLNAYQIYDLRLQQQQATIQTAEYQRRYQEVTRDFPPSPTSADNLVSAVQAAENLGSVKRTPEAAMKVLAKSLDQHPDVRLKTLGWKYGTRDFDAEGTRRADPAAPQGPLAAVPSRRQSAFIEAEVHPFNGDYRGALDTINLFVESLRKDPYIAQVRIVALPLNVSPTMSLSGSTSETPNLGTSAPFRLNLVFRPTL